MRTMILVKGMLVNRWLVVTWLLLLFASVAEAKEWQGIGVQTEAASNGWRGITPFSSTRLDVERLLGPSQSSLGEIFTYDLPENRVDVAYAPDPCKTSTVNAPPSGADVVIKITVTPKKPLLVKDLALDKKKYRRNQLDHPENWVEYLNSEAGIIVEAVLNGREELVISTIYRPTERDREQRCGHKALKQTP